MARATREELYEMLRITADAADELSLVDLAEDLRRVATGHYTLETAARRRESPVQQLEDMIDRSSVPHVLYDLSEVCQAKATHIRENWGDETLARTWERVSRWINAIADRVDRTTDI